jgi:hypothetical protein
MGCEIVLVVVLVLVLGFWNAEYEERMTTRGRVIPQGRLGVFSRTVLPAGG